MPRKAPTQVIEQRVTLGDLERSQIIPLIDETRKIVKTGRIVSQVASATVATGALAIGAGVVITGYAFYQWVNDESVLDGIKSWWSDSIINPIKSGAQQSADWAKMPFQQGPATWFEGPSDKPPVGSDDYYAQQMRDAGMDI
jgi:hypothetical protein